MNILNKILENQQQTKALKFRRYDKLNYVYGGIQLGRLIAITAGPGVGKTTFLKNILIDLLESNKDKDVHVLYYALEESEEYFMFTVLSILAMYIDNEYINVRELIGIEKIKPSTLQYLKESSILQRTQDIMSRIRVFSDYYDPDEIFKSIEDNIKEIGVEVDIDSNFNKLYDFKDKIVIPVIDHINLLSNKRLTMKETIDYFVEHIIHKVINKQMGMPAIVVHQQALESEGLEAMKKRKGKPTIANLGDSRTPSRTYHHVLGLYDPSRYNIESYKGMEVTDDSLVILPLKVRDFRPLEIGMKYLHKSRFLVQV